MAGSRSWLRSLVAGGAGLEEGGASFDGGSRDQEIVTNDLHREVLRTGTWGWAWSIPGDSYRAKLRRVTTHSRSLTSSEATPSCRESREGVRRGLKGRWGGGGCSG
eukprot:764571-Hanusia_phi.AAC.3